MSDTLTHARSEQLFAEARRRIPGGVNSPVRAFSSVAARRCFTSAPQAAASRTSTATSTSTSSARGAP